MKFSSTVFLAVASLTAVAATASKEQKNVVQLRRRIEKYSEARRRTTAADTGAAKTTLMNVQRRRANMLPEGETGVEWEAGSFTFGTYMREYVLSLHYHGVLLC